MRLVEAIHSNTEFWAGPTLLPRGGSSIGASQPSTKCLWSSRSRSRTPVLPCSTSDTTSVIQVAREGLGVDTAVERQPCKQCPHTCELVEWLAVVLDKGPARKVASGTVEAPAYVGEELSGHSLRLQVVR